MPGGLLGADYAIENGRYRFAKVYGGLNWNPELRSPLTEPGVEREGGRVPAGRRRAGRPGAGQPLQLLREHLGQARSRSPSGRRPTAKGSRTVSVVPIANELAAAQPRLGRGQPAQGRRGDGRRASRTSTCPTRRTQGYTYFTRYFYPQANKEAVILDERYNSGGSVADYYIDVLQKKLIAYWVMRYGADMKTPSGSIQGPKVMLADENAGSGGDLLPWMFRKFQVGPIVGKRTWGGLVGILGYPGPDGRRRHHGAQHRVLGSRQGLGRRERGRARPTSTSSRRRPT